MNHSPSETPLGNPTVDTVYAEPHLDQSSDEVQTPIEELSLQETAFLHDVIPTTEHLTTDTPTETTSDLSYQDGNAAPVLISRIASHEGQQVTDFGELAQQIAKIGDDIFRPITTDNNELDDTNVGQQNETNIDLCILSTEPKKLPNIFSTRVKKNKHGKRQLPRFDIVIEEELLKKPSIDDYHIPEGSTDFVYHERVIPVYVQDLYGTSMIGNGAFGSVYAIELPTLPNTLLAVKRLARSMTNEIKIMELVATGSCPYIIDYYCSVINPGTDELCMCMEYMDTSLAAFYRTMHSMNDISFNNLDDLLRRITYDTATGLSYLERKEIIHRDIKPANLLINQNGIVKICDFGISLSFSETQLHYGAIGGTENYMPPTLAHSIKDDMWALGISLYEIRDGENPFASEDSTGKFIRIRIWNPIISTTVSRDMQQLILHLLEKDPRNRPDSYIDILNEPAIWNMTEVPSADECDFVRRVIGKIPQLKTSDEA